MSHFTPLPWYARAVVFAVFAPVTAAYKIRDAARATGRAIKKVAKKVAK